MTVPALDHLILLAPSPASESLPTATSLFSSLGFTVLQGGTHKDGLTSNILIVLEDGVYIEIISFEEQTTEEGKEKKNNHWWGSKAPGWIDFCLLGTPSQDEKVRSLYNSGVKGGRQTKDGKELKWEVTFPKLGDGERRGAIPFFCQDIDGTKREWRAPPASPSHPNQAPAISSLTFLCSKGKTQHHKEILSSILSQPIDGSLRLSTPLSSSEVEVKILEESTQEHSDWIEAHGEGIYEVGVVVDQTWAEENKGRKLQEEWIEPSLEEAGYGRLNFQVV